MTTPSVKISQTFNGRVEWLIPGGYFKLLLASSPVDVECWKNGVKVFDAKACDAGFYQRVRFDKIVLVNPLSQAVDFLAADEEGGSDRFTGVIAVAGAAHAPSAQVAGIASAQILAANVNRKYLAIQNQSATEDAYVRGDGAAATVGNGSFKIGPGQTWEPNVAPTGAVNAIRGAATNANLHVIEA